MKAEVDCLLFWGNPVRRCGWSGNVLHEWQFSWIAVLGLVARLATKRPPGDRRRDSPGRILGEGNSEGHWQSD
ncbi:MAG: hypothetical protein VXY07_05415 [Planctomycetota bacterium]|nr:hypothetical protein [Planctomycetota bacterium]MEC8782246.1 hypothetical protein [Planctomycetota bacterium]MEC8863963.1 hypothetical protein [Planctomycetota bacterium]